MKELSRAQEIDRSIIREFRVSIWNAFTKAVKTYELIQPGDRIAVCVSGGKDSMLMAKCMQHFQKYGNIPFKLEFLCMNPGCGGKLESNSKKCGDFTVASAHISDENFRGGK